MMSSQSFLWIQVAVGAALLVLLLWRRSNKQPTVLKLKEGEPLRPSFPSYQTGQNQNQNQSRSENPSRSLPQQQGPRPRARQLGVSEETLQESRIGAEKSLNVLFNYNGHTWDAFEILGIPAGAPPALVESAYRRMKAKTAPESQAFIEAAYQAIQITRRRA